MPCMLQTMWIYLVFGMKYSGNPLFIRQICHILGSHFNVDIYFISLETCPTYQQCRQLQGSNYGRFIIEPIAVIPIVGPGLAHMCRTTTTPPRALLGENFTMQPAGLCERSLKDY